ncbi:MAG TPA: hypothetical protein VM577_01650 [Anaerovoracaceae bacterium]|nr:hypothetical protein [Anaerovoracaceae bacterium]
MNVITVVTNKDGIKIHSVGHNQLIQAIYLLTENEDLKFLEKIAKLTFLSENTNRIFINANGKEFNAIKWEPETLEKCLTEIYSTKEFPVYFSVKTFEE